MPPWKTLNYNLDPLLKQRLVAMHHAGAYEYVDIVFTGNYRGRELKNFDVGLDFGYFDYKLVPGLEKDLSNLLDLVTPENITVVTHAPGESSHPHVDSYKFLQGSTRHCSIIFPLTPKKEYYTPTLINPGGIPGGIKVPYSDCYLLNTDVEHWVKNNEHWRVNLQIWFKETFDEIANIVN